MKRIQFSIDINADKVKIWNVLWEDATYRDWTSVFHAGSHMVAKSLDAGSKVLFLSPELNGMYSKIDKHIKYEMISFRHLGEVRDGQELPIDEKTREWSGFEELYTLTQKSDVFTLTAEMDIRDEEEGFMAKVFPKALEKVKVLSER